MVYIADIKEKREYQPHPTAPQLAVLEFRYFYTVVGVRRFLHAKLANECHVYLGFYSSQFDSESCQFSECVCDLIFELWFRSGFGKDIINEFVASLEFLDVVVAGRRLIKYSFRTLQHVSRDNLDHIRRTQGYFGDIIDIYFNIYHENNKQKYVQYLQPLLFSLILDDKT
jgi:hypothetical protein